MVERSAELRKPKSPVAALTPDPPVSQLLTGALLTIVLPPCMTLLKFYGLVATVLAEFKQG